eukprot:11968618-Karenia_brevis.AAC.1
MHALMTLESCHTPLNHCEYSLRFSCKFKNAPAWHLSAASAASSYSNIAPTWQALKCLKTIFVKQLPPGGNSGFLGKGNTLGSGWGPPLGARNGLLLYRNGTLGLSRFVDLMCLSQLGPPLTTPGVSRAPSTLPSSAPSPKGLSGERGH